MMISDHWSEIKRLYAEALERVPAARDAFLEQVCAHDPELLGEVRSLLEANLGDRFLEPPEYLGAGLLAADDVSLLGQRIGSYRLERSIGAGGMGNVYLAARVEGGFEQFVAVKILKRGMDTDALLSQFRREQQALAMLDHPCIARLYDGGAMEDGRPYFIMEYVDGVPIDRYCDEKRLSAIQRLEIFLVICDAVAYAHQHLVVHRDLKPANILVTADGVPKLLDFGIAKLLVDTEPGRTTRPADRRLTPEYASPEQITGRHITTATDSYSLGVILYELLSGQRPYLFKTRSTTHIEMTICTIEPAPPSVAVIRNPARSNEDRPDEGGVNSRVASGVQIETPKRLSRRLSGDLDTIVLTALRKEPIRRYATVEAFATDIRRFLGGLPIAARKDSLAYRVQRFIGRHQVGVAVSGLLIIILTIGVTAIIRYARIADIERDLANKARTEAEAHSRIAAHERDEAFAARDEAAAISQFLHDALSAPDPAMFGPSLTVRQLLDGASARLEADLGDRPRVQEAIRSTIGRTYLVLGLYAEAEAHLQRAFDERSVLLGTDHHSVAESRIDLATLRYMQGRLAEAETLLREALRTHERLRDHDNHETARVCNDLGAVLRASGKLDEAVQMHRRAMAANERAFGRESLQVAMNLNNLAAVSRGRGDHEAAMASLDEVLRIRRALLPPRHPLLVQSVHNVALTELSFGHLERAEELLREAVEMGEEIFGPDHPDLAIVLRGLAEALMRRGQPDEALPFLRRVMRLFELRYPAEHPRRQATHSELGRCLLDLQHYEEAEQVLLALLENQPSAKLQTAPLADAVVSLIELYEKTGRTDNAAEWKSRQTEGKP